MPDDAVPQDDDAHALGTHAAAALRMAARACATHAEVVCAYFQRTWSRMYGKGACDIRVHAQAAHTRHAYLHPVDGNRRASSGRACAQTRRGNTTSTEQCTATTESECACTVTHTHTHAYGCMAHARAYKSACMCMRMR